MRSTEKTRLANLAKLRSMLDKGPISSKTARDLFPELVPGTSRRYLHDIGAVVTQVPGLRMFIWHYPKDTVDFDDFKKEIKEHIAGLAHTRLCKSGLAKKVKVKVKPNLSPTQISQNVDKLLDRIKKELDKDNIPGKILKIDYKALVIASRSINKVRVPCAQLYSYNVDGDM